MVETLGGAVQLKGNLSCVACGLGIGEVGGTKPVKQRYGLGVVCVVHHKLHLLQHFDRLRYGAGESPGFVVYYSKGPVHQL